MTVTTLAVPAVEVSEQMRNLAAELRQIAADIEQGKVRSAAICHVEAGPDMFVTSSWASMSGRITLTGGLFKLLQVVGES